MDINLNFTICGRMLDFTVADYFRWGFPNLWDGADHGTFTEFLVKTSLDSPASPEGTMLIYYDGYSVATSAASYLQSDDEAHPDHISFSCIPRRHRDPHPDVFVFCLFKAMSSGDTPTELSNWDFYIMSGESIRDRETITLPSLISSSPVMTDFYGIASGIENIIKSRLPGS